MDKHVLRLQTPHGSVRAGGSSEHDSSNDLCINAAVIESQDISQVRLETINAVNGYFGKIDRHNVRDLVLDLSRCASSSNPERAQVWVESTLRMRQLNGLYRKFRAPRLRIASVSRPDRIRPDEALLRYHRSVEIEARAVKYLVDSPREINTPTNLSGFVCKRAQRLGVKCEFLKFGRKLGVATARVGAASECAPTILHLTYDRTRRSNRPRVWLCGKGVTMDTGGIAIKNQAGMRLMKSDMVGAATVAGAVFAAARLELPIRVDALLAIAENSVGPKSILPGDLLRYPNGVTVEVTDTDAEGRLMLADLCLIARDAGAKGIVTLGTLSEVVSWVIGRSRAGLQSNSANLTEQLTKSADCAGEPVWALPIGSEHARDLNSDWVDLVNSSGAAYGGIQPVIFLQHFCEAVPFAHLEMSGPAFLPEWGSTGATGFGVGLLLEFLRLNNAAEGVIP